ncbi:Rrf2 family transcriptional regulator [filamentous cyanobacterium LEGE 11480]|uniref:Rrf2 family transcriptional regulator n=1 Tax=Romeriopsis navalis LEGE 11480 TaxID=2777977 RepID=A0A928VQC2_9CYAN|nr:Rrf2 family transcriptional regulator [Romeriopsis navalis]MBE9031853.1 Rrf2 family transcriptional regulator [Romeriopsis navalis LEGE 11480]
MELSCKSEYALLALLELVDHYASGEPLQIRQISAQQNIPDRYLEQLLATLRRAGIVRSQRGAKGGYLLAREPGDITLLDVVSCLEGFDAKSATADVPPNSDQTLGGTVIGELWEEACQAANAVLKGCSLKDLRDRRDARKQLDFMYYI